MYEIYSILHPIRLAEFDNEDEATKYIKNSVFYYWVYVSKTGESVSEYDLYVDYIQ